MQESVTYQAIKAEGSREALQQVAINLLREGMEVSVVSRVTGLLLDQVQLLAHEPGNWE